jgi:hypothetical protein
MFSSAKEFAFREYGPRTFSATLAASVFVAVGICELPKVSEGYQNLMSFAIRRILVVHLQRFIGSGTANSPTSGSLLRCSSHYPKSPVTAPDLVFQSQQLTVEREDNFLQFHHDPPSPVNLKVRLRSLKGASEPRVP